MQYINPFNRLNIKPNSDGTIDSKSIKLARKRWLAEFEVQGTTTIRSGNIELDKQSVFSLFDSLENNDQLSYHLELTKYPNLLSFIEQLELDYFERPETIEHTSAGFQMFIGPFFAHQYNQCFSAAFKKRNLNLLQTLSNVELPIPIEFESNCHKSTYRHLSQKLQELKLLAQENKRKNLSTEKMSIYFNKKTIALLNALPAYYDGFLINYAKALNQLALTLYNEHFRYLLAIEILKRGLSLKINDDTTNQLNDILRQIEKQTKNHQRSIPGFFASFSEGKSENRTRTIVIIGGLALGVILALLR